MHPLTYAATLFALAATTATAQPADVKPLTIGDEAPRIDISHWLKGEQVDELEDGQVYVIEFWATWCGPCRASMPHLSELQKQYGDEVKIIGISDEALPTVVGFLTREDGDQLWYDKINYTLTTDPDRSVMTDYFRAAGQRGIPTAFIVGGEGHVEWIGHPMRMDEPLAAVVAGNWDRAAFKAEFEAQMEAERIRQEFSLQLRQARQQEDWQRVADLLEEAIARDEEQFGYLRTEQALTLITKLDQADKGVDLLRERAEAHWDDAMQLNAIAWSLVDDTGISDRDVLKFAMKVAERAAKLTDEQDAAILDTLARVHFEMGDVRKAIKVQEQAIEQAEAGPMKQQLQEVLERYKDAK